MPSSPDTELEQSGRQDLAQHGLSPASVDQVMSGRASTQEQVAEALARMGTALRDPAWKERWLGGGSIEKHDMAVWNSIISLAPRELSPVIEAARRDMW
jgi:hypothetical protein